MPLSFCLLQLVCSGSFDGPLARHWQANGSIMQMLFPDIVFQLRGMTHVSRSVPVSLIPPFFMKLIASLQKWWSVIKTADSNSAFRHLDSGQVLPMGPDGVFTRQTQFSTENFSRYTKMERPVLSWPEPESKILEAVSEPFRLPGHFGAASK